ncbi:hypothetical protein UA08_06210 [Talaromyces atroroseus]|uniref:Uncharacterized protein n=1 Tax=Talaromyces atroroseus TaxID=1441469 RepID=A0A225ABG4_TALAT|nr:hypothetical protein UA08_06210 [Talaromyces atroroseus]OKL58391.1 hypothetical protein UA08_06210 [Talaromyces atroroseus]
MYRGFYSIKQEEDYIMSSSALSSGKHHGMKGGREAPSTSPVSASASDPESKSGSKNRRRIQLAPETTQLLPAPGSALPFPYHHPSMTNSNGNTPLITSASSDSFGSRVHQQQADPSTLSPLVYGMTYARSQSLSDLGNYHRVDSLQRESPYVAAVAAAAAASSGGAGLMEDIYNTPYGLHSPSCIPATSTSDTMTDYYGSLDSPKAWSHAADVAMAADLARSQNTIFYAADVPTLFPTANLLSPGDMSTHRVLPMPTTSTGSGSGPSSVNVVNTPYLRDMDMVATSDLSFIPGGEDDDDDDEERPTNIYSPTAKSSKSSSFVGRVYGKPDAATATPERLSHALGGRVASSHHHHGHHGQNYMARYTAIAEGSLDTLPITTTSSSAFTRSGTTDSSSDIEEPLMMSMSRKRRQKQQH